MTRENRFHFPISVLYLNFLIWKKTETIFLVGKKKWNQVLILFVSLPHRKAIENTCCSIWICCWWLLQLCLGKKQNNFRHLQNIQSTLSVFFKENESNHTEKMNHLLNKFITCTLISVIYKWLKTSQTITSFATWTH